MTLRITIPETPSDADREAILAPLRAFNASRAGDPGLRPVAILLTDQAGRDVGGLWGKIAYDWLFVELLAVPEEWRGGNYGKALMQEAESIARAHGCVGCGWTPSNSRPAASTRSWDSSCSASWRIIRWASAGFSCASGFRNRLRRCSEIAAEFASSVDGLPGGTDHP
ncbi:MAG: GNAT family N-acetyltransferase [Sphingomonas sp.]|nr:GNAT family N-acetyltransferase [Sphingomonas sp.]MDX3883688.1 GNAT family N-acetyltransferase [Sphingomonas sp.]